MNKIITVKNRSLLVSFPFDREALKLVKSLPEATWDSKRKVWILPVSDSSRTSVDVLLKHGFSMTEEVKGVIFEYEQKQAEVMQACRRPIPDMPSTIKLMPHQEESMEFIRTHHSVLLGDSPGLGKTINALAVTFDCPKVLILTMATLKLQFGSEIEKFLPASKYVVITGVPAVRAEQWKADVQYYICNYELLLKDLEYMQSIKWDYIVADECTRLSNHQNSQYKALMRVPSNRRLAMTGTAISNSPLDIYGIINWLSPKALGSFYSFCSRYVIKDFFGSPRQFIHMDELSERIKPYYIRRTKEQVLKELPEKVQIMHLVDLSEKEKKLYQNIKKMLLDELLGADMSKVEFVSQLQNGMTNLLRLRQCVDSLELLGEDKESSKLKHLKELIPTLGEGRKIIIFSEFAQMCRILNRELPDSLMIIGDIHQSLRGAIIHEFNTSTTSNILIMSSAGAFGLNLQVSDCIINYDSPWSVAKLEQREGRAHRIGQKNTVFVYSLVAHKTVDQYVRNKLMSKKDIAEQVMPISELINVLQ